MSKLKILILKSSSEGLHDAISKSEDLNAKSGPFDCVLIHGNIVDDLDHAKLIKSSTPIYFFNGHRVLTNKPGSINVSDNVVFLNGYGILKLLNGIRIGYLTGDERFLNQSENALHDVLKNSEMEGIDLLLTHQVGKPFGLETSDQVVDEIIKSLKPKYHFASLNSETFVECPAFRWKNTELVTRCIKLATFGSGKKWAYAFNITLSVPMSGLTQDMLGPNPYEVDITPKRRLSTSTPTQQGTGAKKIKRVLPGDCRFCLSNPQVQQHLIIAIGTNVYMTIAKGPLTVPMGKMNFSGHCLLISVKHVSKLCYKDQECSNLTQDATFNEMVQYESDVAEMNSKRFDTCTVVFEIDYENSIHFHKQVMPVPQYLIGKFLASLERQVHFNNEKFTKNARLCFREYNSDDKEYLDIINDVESNYLKFTVYESRNVYKIYLAVFQKNERVDLQFGRRVVAFLLNLSNRVKWDSPNCRQSLDEENKEVFEFRKTFVEFDKH
ncbi:LAMI_0E01860g1_1 [Lachancea mirantina]|uniref:LAMI_0E01860g1_1 n=1 Tax=Lachancea mirantina TaxID=1230905 RepID=A0A1G4JIV4_9SACH|nr:LAMI_0E01860g1_1 [Lachancea mirantina]